MNDLAILSQLDYLEQTLLALQERIQIRIPIREGIQYRLRDNDGTGKVHKKGKNCVVKKNRRARLTLQFRLFWPLE